MSLSPPALTILMADDDDEAYQHETDDGDKTREAPKAGKSSGVKGRKKKTKKAEKPE